MEVSRHSELESRQQLESLEVILFLYIALIGKMTSDPSERAASLLVPLSIN